MASILERAKSQLEWLQHGDLIIRILGSFGVGTALKAYLQTYTKMNPVWITPIWLGATTVVVIVAMYVIPRWPTKKEGGSPQDIVVRKEPEQFKDVEEFYRTYDNALLRETEDNVRKESVKFQAGNDRERFITRWFAAITIGFYFENVWLRILGSQIRALELLNHHQVTIDELRVPYHDASQKYPIEYTSFPFETWYWFLTTEGLVRQDGLTVSITVRGREFLKSLVQYGRSASDRWF
jgi:hypothetical protein